MTVLFVGEGECEVGSPPHEEQQGAGRARQRRPTTIYAAGDAYPAGGVLPVLAQKIIPRIAEGALALRWREITRLSPLKKSGLDAKAKAAVLLARRHGCKGLVLVVDNDGKDDEDRLEKLKECKPLAAGQPVVACGLAVQSIEAWTLGAPEAIATVLGVGVGTVRKEYPGPHVETLLENSGKEEQRPKGLVSRLAQLGHREDTIEFRREVAEQTDIAALERACPAGFAPFAEELRVAFSGWSPGE